MTHYLFSNNPMMNTLLMVLYMNRVTYIAQWIHSLIINLCNLETLKRIAKSSLMARITICKYIWL